MIENKYSAVTVENDYDKELFKMADTLDILIKNFQSLDRKLKNYSTVKDLYVLQYNILSVGFDNGIIYDKFIHDGSFKLKSLFYAKQAYLNVYEYFKHYDSHSIFLLRVSKINNNTDTLFQIISDNIKVFKKTYNYNGLIKTIRNMESAHFDKDIVKRYQLLNNVNFVLFSNMLIEFLKINLSMQDLLNALIKEYYN